MVLIAVLHFARDLWSFDKIVNGDMKRASVLILVVKVFIIKTALPKIGFYKAVKTTDKTSLFLYCLLSFLPMSRAMLE